MEIGSGFTSPGVYGIFISHLFLCPRLERRSSIPTQDYRVNEQVRTREVLLIGTDGEQLGVMSPLQAMQLGREAGLDLVEVAPTARPPVCRLMDYGRFRYLATKKERESRKTQHNNLLREIRFRPRIAEHDQQAKLKRIREFLAQGDKVKLSVMFRGREITHPEIGMVLLRSVVENLKESAKVDAPPAMEGRFMNVIVSPTVRREPKVESAPEGEEESHVQQAEAEAAQT